MDIEKVKADFDKVTAGHTMKIAHDDGVHRDLVFSTNGDFCGKYRLVTWPGSLCITGDYGTYVFERTTDMFRFFGGGEKINPHYWGEKLASISRFGNGYDEFSQDLFETAVKDRFEQYWREGDDKEAVWGKIESEVLGAETEEQAIQCAMEFKHEEEHVFEDFWEAHLRDYTFHYIWCLFAIQRGIATYNAHHASRGEAA